MSAPVLKTVGSRTILYVMAVDAEYGPHLKQRFAPLFTGVGPVEAALSVTRHLSGLLDMPDLVVCLGSAGSQKLEHCGVYQANSVSWRDMDASALGFEKGVTPFLDQPAVHKLTDQIPSIPGASLSTGANIVSGSAYAAIEADMVDMETYAVLRVCQTFGVPLIALRGISDGISDLAELSDWTDYLHIIDEKLAHAVDLAEQWVLNRG